MSGPRRMALWAIAMVLLAGCPAEPIKPAPTPTPTVDPSATPPATRPVATRPARATEPARYAYVTARALVGGRASWYGPGFQGRRTASGARFNQYSFTAASRSLAFGTRLIVTNLATGRAVVVVVNDRGPFVYDRTLDLSAAAFAAIAPAGQGVCRVRVEVVR